MGWPLALPRWFMWTSRAWLDWGARRIRAPWSWRTDALGETANPIPRARNGKSATRLVRLYAAADSSRGRFRPQVASATRAPRMRRPP
jgi:hypothetical protein